ncbi:nuclear protein [Ascosphaera aggregata]|nr:nuclear protein [Ascosphaera aggregata]
MLQSLQLHEDLSSDPVGRISSSVIYYQEDPSCSDKENRDEVTTQAKKQRRRRRMEQEASQVPEMSGTAPKRRRLDATQARESRSMHQRVLDETKNDQIYDPDQSPEERRKVRQQYRSLVSEMNDSRAEYLQASSHKLDNAVEQANALFSNVKQTSDATVDSRFLVSAADLSLKRITQAVLGDAAASIDVDEFVSKCITYMRNSPINNDMPMSTQNRRAHFSQMNDDAEDDEDPLNWEWLGRRACFPNNTRPPVTGFLLGPLSVRKRTRLFTQRRARERVDSTQAVRPQELRQIDLEKQETSNLTNMCSGIREILEKAQQTAEQKAVSVIERLGPDASDEDRTEALYKIGISDDGGVPLFKFCINPHSFGQTVENLFYVSFLVRDGTVGISLDSNDLPTLIPAAPQSLGEARRRGVQKHQAIFEIDFKTWKQLIKVFNIKESMIPHRDEEEGGGTAATWYT